MEIRELKARESQAVAGVVQEEKVLPASRRMARVAGLPLTEAEIFADLSRDVGNY